MPYPAVVKQIREAGNIFFFSRLLTVLHYGSSLTFISKRKWNVMVTGIRVQKVQKHKNEDEKILN